MNWLTLLPSLLLASVGATCLGLAWLAMRHHDTPGAFPLAGLNTALAIWTIAYAVQLLQPGKGSQLLSTRFVYLGVVTAPVTWLLFVARYTQRDSWIRPGMLALLAIVPTLTTIFAWTNDFHGLLWREVTQVRGPFYTTLSVRYGPWFAAHAFFSYMLLLVGTVIMVRAFLTDSYLHRRQSVALLLSVLAPWIGNALHLTRKSPIYPLDITPFSLAFSAFVFGWGLSRLRPLEVLPVDHSSVIGSISDAVVVFDSNGRTVIINPAAEQLLGLKASQMIGRPAEETLEAVPAIVDKLGSSEQVILELTRQVGGRLEHLEATVTPLHTGGQRLSGQLVLLRDVTFHRRTMESQAFLAEASALLASSLEYKTILETITRLTVPTLADLCAIHQVRPDGTLHRVALATANPTTQILAEELDNHLGPDTPYSYPLVLKTGKPYYKPFIGELGEADVTGGERQLSLLRAIGPCSILTVPLVVPEQILGTLTFLRDASGRHYGPEDLELALDLARRAALAIVHAHLVADLRASEASARAANDAAAAANQAKSVFLIHTSHEIRTPLTGVVGLTNLLLDTELDHWQGRIVAMLRSSADSLMAVINDILDLSKIESGKLELTQAPLDLVACIEEALDLVAIQAEAKGLDLSYTIAPGTPTVVMSDYARLRQVLVNLLSNGTKFTPRGSVAVSLEVAQAGAPGESWELRFSVRDSGIGIAREHQAQLFQAFSQVASPGVSQSIGSGLGLTISKRLCELMGGSIGVISEREQGSTFSFTIRAIPRPDLPGAVPLVQVPHLAGRRLLLVAPPRPSRQALVDQAHVWGMRTLVIAPEALAAMPSIESEAYDLAIIVGTTGDTALSAFAALPGADRLPRLLLLPLKLGMASPELHYRHVDVLTLPLKYTQLFAVLEEHFLAAHERSAAAPASMAQRQPSHPALRILIAEDDEVNQLVVQRLLAQLGYDSIVVASGEAALKALLSERYHVALLDLQIPDLGGLEVAARVRHAQTAATRPYLVALTAFSLAEQRQHVLTAGMDDYVAKPPTFAALADLISRAEGWLRERRGAAQAPPIDPTRLRQSLHDTSGAVLVQVVDTYLDNAPRLLAAITTALAREDGEAIAAAAHRLRSSSASVTADELAALCAELEELIATNSRDLWPAVVQRLVATYVRVEGALRTLGDQQPPGSE